MDAASASLKLFASRSSARDRSGLEQIVFSARVYALWQSKLAPCAAAVLRQTNSVMARTFCITLPFRIRRRILTQPGTYAGSARRKIITAFPDARPRGRAGALFTFRAIVFSLRCMSRRYRLQSVFPRLSVPLELPTPPVARRRDSSYWS